MRVECYGATLAQDGNEDNEDAFAIIRGETTCAAVCDGAGRAQQSAGKTLKLFEKLYRQTSGGQVGLFSTWANYISLLDSSLLGIAQSTFVAVACYEGRMVGACVGDSRAYLRRRDGKVSILMEHADKHRLGSGQANPAPIHLQAEKGDILLLMSDGAWTPLSLYRLQKILSKAASMHLADLAPAILSEAGRGGRIDDMTVVVMKVM